MWGCRCPHRTKVGFSYVVKKTWYSWIRRTVGTWEMTAMKGDWKTRASWWRRRQKEVACSRRGWNMCSDWRISRIGLWIPFDCTRTKNNGKLQFDFQVPCVWHSCLLWNTTSTKLKERIQKNCRARINMQKNESRSESCHRTFLEVQKSQRNCTMEIIRELEFDVDDWMCGRLEAVLWRCRWWKLNPYPKSKALTEKKGSFCC